MAGLDLSWLGGGLGGLLRPGRDTNEGGSIYGGQRTALKDMAEGLGTATDEQFAADAKKAKTLRALFDQYGADFGMPELKDKAHTMSLPELEGGLKAFVMKQGLEEQKQQAEARNVDMATKQLHAQLLANAENRRAQDERNQMAGQSALGRGLAALDTLPPESIRAPGVTERSEFFRAAGPDLGYAATTPGGSKLIDQFLNPEPSKLTPGMAYDIPGVQNRKAIANSTGTITVVDTPPAVDTSKPPEVTSDRFGNMWYWTADGKPHPIDERKPNYPIGVQGMLAELGSRLGRLRVNIGTPNEAKGDAQAIKQIEAQMAEIQKPYEQGRRQSSASAAETSPSVSFNQPQTFEDEAAARAVGKRTGDKVYLRGVGLVRLK